ncbi:PaaI family thioesterase [Pseudomonas sp. P1.31]|jgi:uncharacterized protein (TIGR00369 family)|uniref:PaaI family thioesterase n=1 Tax=unclassified Pseudomonas TaxID=196821 RepID=UPI00069FC9A6|nr:PaaI family thioesterase [Pseudomonas sp. P1.31]
MNTDALFWKVINGELPTPDAAKLLGWTFIDYDEEKSEAHIVFEASASLTNLMGNIQGGMLAAMLDDCMGPALYACLAANQIAVTVESKTNYINPALPGRIFGTGRIEHLKREICFTSGQLSDASGNVLATATATFRISDHSFSRV